MGPVVKDVRQHVGDKATLELVLDGEARDHEALMTSHKLAFRGNSGIWGVQAKARTRLLVLAPNAGDPDQIDTATVSGWTDFRRLRPDAQWRVFRRRSLTDDGDPPPIEPIDEAEAPGGTMLLTDFCEGVPPLVTSDDGAFTEYEIGPSPAGAAGAFTLYSGFIQRARGSRRAETPGDVAEFAAHVLAPVEHLVVDVLAHRSLGFARGPALHLSSAAFNDGSVRADYTRLPIMATLEDLSGPPVLSSAVAPQTERVAAAVFERAGWSLDEFLGVRVLVDYPPFPSVAVLRLPLDAAASHKSRRRVAKRSEA